MKCPICNNTINQTENNKNLPFCSERCRLIDLGDWLSENYSVQDNELNFSVYNNDKDQ